MKSVWNFEIERPKFEALKGDSKVDVVIIGGGMSGLICGYMLSKAGVDTVVCEAEEICLGVTQNTTAKITYHHGAIFSKMIKRFGKEFAELYIKANEDALNLYRDICSNIDCDFTEQNSFVYSVDNELKILNEFEGLKSLGCPAEYHNKLPLPFKISGGVEIPNQAQFNPLKFAYKIAENLKIYEHTKVLEVISDGVITERGKISAKKVIVATHFPYINKYGGYFLKMYQHRSYVIGLENACDIDGMYVDESDKGMSFRSYKKLLILGGGGHRTGKRGGNWEELRRFAKKYYPNSNEVYHWATQDCMTIDNIPYIGQYSVLTPYMYVATGFNKWGMTSSMVAANLLTDFILGKENKLSNVFSPQRSILRPQIIINSAESIKNLLTPTVPRCPHLGCALKYNKIEHTWDCPCHGSRFTEDGELINNPSTKNLK